MWCAETVCACRMVREYLEWEQALAGEKDDNPWSWVRKRLIGVRGYKPWFGHLFTKDQQEMRYRDIHADLRAVREHAEKEAKEKSKEARSSGGAAGGGAGGPSSSKGKGRAEKERPAYADMDPMRRAHLFGVSIKAHVVSPWGRQAQEAESSAAAAEASAAAGAQPGQHVPAGEGSSSGAHVEAAAPAPCEAVPPPSAAAGGEVKGGSKKRKPSTPKAADGKPPKTAATAKGNRGPRDRAWIRFFYFPCVPSVLKFFLSSLFSFPVFFSFYLLPGLTAPSSMANLRVV